MGLSAHPQGFMESDYQTRSFQCKEIELLLGKGKPHSIKTDESNKFQRGGEGGHSLIKTLYSKLFFNLKLLKPQCLAINPQYFLSPKIQGGGLVATFPKIHIF